MADLTENQFRAVILAALLFYPFITKVVPAIWFCIKSIADSCFEAMVGGILGVTMKTIEDFCFERVLQMPTTTHAMLEMLINDHGVELSVENKNLTHEERVKIIREIMAAAERREKPV